MVNFMKDIVLVKLVKITNLILGPVFLIKFDLRTCEIFVSVVLLFTRCMIIVSIYMIVLYIYCDAYHAIYMHMICHLIKYNGYNKMF